MSSNSILKLVEVTHICTHTHTYMYACSIPPHLLASELIGSDALHQGDGVRVELVGLVGQVHDGKGDTEAQPLHVAHLRESGRGGRVVFK